MAADELLPDGLLRIGPDVALTCETLEVAARRRTIQVRLSPAAVANLQAEPTEPFGPRESAEPRTAEPPSTAPSDEGTSLLATLGVACGPFTPPVFVRATMILHAHALTRSKSAVPAKLVQTYVAPLGRGIVPAVPLIGSGGEGDRIPLAHIVRTLQGERQVFWKDERWPAAERLGKARLVLPALDNKSAQALIRGSAYSTAYVALTWPRTERLLTRAELLTGWLYRLLGCRLSVLDPRQNPSINQEGGRQSAATIRGEAERDGVREDPSRPVEEPAALRDAPRVLSECREQLILARRLLGEVMNGGAGNLAGAVAALHAALSRTEALVEGQIGVVLDPRQNGGAPPALAWEAERKQGLAGALLLTSALVAEMRRQEPSAAGPPSTILAARSAYAQTPCLARLLAVLGVALVQLTALRVRGRATGKVTGFPSWMPLLTPLQEDRALHDDLERIARAWLCLEPR
jgi:histidine ammonia-lyase/tyrosine ammonia-lyase